MPSARRRGARGGEGLWWEITEEIVVRIVRMFCWGVVVSVL